jgi:hypothetical protein
LEDLLALTPPNHIDFDSVKGAVQTMQTVAAEITQVINDKKNLEQLLEIQASLVVTGSYDNANEWVVPKLASMERKFVKQGDLKKVCRRKNKLFRFFLCNDYLLYGSALGNGSYTFHR